MKKVILILLVLCFLGCNTNVAGTLGGGNIYEFKCGEKTLNECLDNLEDAKMFSVPKKWKKYDNWEQKGYGFLNGKVFYMKPDVSLNFEEEIYFVSVLKLDTLPKSRAQTSIRSVFRMVDNKPRWLNCDKIDNDEMEIIEKRFQKSILEKIVNSPCGCNSYKLVTPK